MSIENTLQSIDIPNSNIQFTVSQIEYDFTELKQRALDLQDELTTVIVTDETVKSNKKLVAELNKVVNKLEDERKLVKNKILEPYTKLELDVKEVVNIIKETDNSIRLQIKELEEIERENKYLEISQIFNKRASLYDIDDFIHIDDCVTNAHLNKTVTLKTAEQDIVDYLEKVKSDISTINLLENSDRVLKFYLGTKNINLAIQMSREDESRDNQVQAINKSSKEIEASGGANTEPRHSVVITGDKNFKLFQLLMKDNDIEYEILG